MRFSQIYIIGEYKLSIFIKMRISFTTVSNLFYIFLK